MENKRLLILSVVVLCTVGLLSVCTPGDVQEEDVQPEDRSGWIGADDALYVGPDGYLYNQLGYEVVLRGVNLGGWMLQETWMCAVIGATNRDGEWANLNTIMAMEGRGWTPAQIQELFDTYQDNLITISDFDTLKSRGVNSIRLPFWYRNFMSDENGTWINGDDGSKAVTKNPGFRRLDWAITQAKKRGIYVILDLHGLPGGQSTNHSTGTIGRNDVYTNPVCNQTSVNLWKALARRYKDEATVAGYDLMNEPQNNSENTGSTNNAWPAESTRAVHETVRMYDILYRAIREVDPDTICIMEGVWNMNMPDPQYVSEELDQTQRHSGKTVVWNQVMYSMHLYDHDRGNIDSRVKELTDARSNWGVAVHIGEFKNNNQGQQDYAYTKYNDNRINWNMWTYKICGGQDWPDWALYHNTDKPNANPTVDSFNEIKEKWDTTLRSGYNETVMNEFFNRGLSHTIPDVFTNSNQDGFPAGGVSGPIFVKDNNTGSGLVK